MSILRVVYCVCCRFSFAVTHTAEAAKDPEYADRIIRLLNASQSQACDPARRDRTREGAAHHANEPVELRDRTQEATTHHTTKPMDGLRTAMERANAMVMENLEEAMAQAQRAEAKVSRLSAIRRSLPCVRVVSRTLTS